MERRAYTSDLTDDRSHALISPTISIGFVVFYVGRSRIDTSRSIKSEGYRSQLSYIPHDSTMPVVRHISRLANEGEIVDELNLDAGHYILIPASSEPGFPFPFSLSALSMSRIELIKRVGEPIVRVSRWCCLYINNIVRVNKYFSFLLMNNDEGNGLSLRSSTTFFLLFCITT